MGFVGPAGTTEPAFTSQDAFVQFRVGTLWVNADYATVNACLTGILLILTTTLKPHRKIAIAVNPAPAIPPAFPYYFLRCNQINLQLRSSSFHIFKNIFPLPLYVACNFLMNIQTMIPPPAFRPRGTP